jgi:excisionase family DNA binding protein
VPVKPSGQPIELKDDFILRDPNGQPLPDLSTASQIADALQVTSRTVLEWEATGKIPAALRTGRTVRFNPAAIVKALAIAV